MRHHRSGYFILVAGLIAPLMGGCGDGIAPEPGYSDPCQTPMGPVLGCPPGNGSPSLSTVADACRRLVGCGVLADINLVASNKRCSKEADCDEGAGEHCMYHSSGKKFVCHLPHLDLRWCVGRLSTGSVDPCDPARGYTAEQLRGIIHCMSVRSCSALGLPFHAKVAPRAVREPLDSYQCFGKQLTIWTATVCDLGLLHYDSGK